MKTYVSIAFLGGDLRQIYAANDFAADGHRVKLLGFEDAQRGGIHEKITIARSVGEVLHNVSVVVLPLPYSLNGVFISAPFGAEEIKVSDVFAALKGEERVFAGMADDRLRAAADERKVPLVDYFAREEMAVQNAVPTAEGALAILINETAFTIHNSRVAVLGYGRIGKTLARNLAALGAKTSAFSQNTEELAWADCAGHRAVSLSELEDALENADIVVNTIPALIMNRERLKLLKKGCFVLDLASKPGGVDCSAAKELDLRTVWASSIPGKTAPISAGRIIKNTIENILNELEV